MKVGLFNGLSRNKTSQREGKAKYVAPALVCFGDIADFTAAASGTLNQENSGNDCKRLRNLPGNNTRC
jgi:hypothetical protein